MYVTSGQKHCSAAHTLRLSFIDVAIKNAYGSKK